MKTYLLPMLALAVMFAGNAQAGLSRMNAMCPGKLEIHVDQGGPVYVNGKEATLKRFNDNYYEAKDAVSGVTLSINNNPDGTSSMSYTGKNRANGICQIAKDAPAATTTAAAKPATKPARETPPASEKACLAAVAKKTNVAGAKLSVIESVGSEAGIQVKVKVPGADAPWTCMTDQKGKVWNVSYSGSEGAL